MATFEESLDAQLTSLAEILSRPPWKQPRDVELRSLLGTLFLQVSIARDLGVAKQGVRDPILDAIRGVKVAELGLDAALRLTARLKDLLIKFGDDLYLLSCYEEEVAFSRRPHEPVGSISWTSLYGDGTPAAVRQLSQGQEVKCEQRKALRDRLLALNRARWHFYDLDRARAGVKGRYMLYLAVVLVILIVGFSIGINVAAPHHIWSQILLAALAGAIGSSLSGAFKLRDEVSTIGQLRGFGPAIAVQPLVGATVGLFSLLLLVSGILNINSSGSQWATRGVIAFTIGFSEPFFLSTVNKVASLATK